MLAFLMALGPEFRGAAPGGNAQEAAKKGAHVDKAEFGKMPDGTVVEAYTLYNRQGASAKVITYGATLTELHVPDKNGKMGDVVLGFDNLEGYLGQHPYFGGTIGRYGNRIAKGKFALDGKEYQLFLNNGPNSLHGGQVGFNRRVWKAEELKDKDGAAVRFSYLSKDGEENYPGNLNVSVTYTLTNTDELKLQYSAETDKDTVLNITNHSYFNLSGTDTGNILKYILYINADKYTPVDSTLIPTGEIASVAGTPLDFLKPTAIGARIGELKEIGGYDHNYALNGKAGTLRVAAKVTDPDSGREMEVLTTEPGVQFYSAIGLNGSIKGKGGVGYEKYGAICLETQHFPDSPNHPNFLSAVLKPGTKFYSETIYKFTAK
ncbi:MAG TPA: aldose epimerase family protein [Verrucomicrobiae bacterium]|jgi:aldose 1-epimerase|nr:aldose epimerase family protein [Verrucomicrobiae bacterium]